MRRISKTGSIISDNKGETMVEVIVAFTLLSIMLVVFSEGISWATKSEVNANKSRTGADNAMIALQQKLAGKSPEDVIKSSESNGSVEVGGTTVSRYTYTVTIDGNTYTYVVYE
ncbi:MAG: prepilin-type N-terminal cleavage/methylation domain-containing protein [Clostridiales bacterium]|nr:prepilin-type N-terminal cleavage/methylation domain-containing protein [Clostridiales bacterium]